MKTFSIIVAVDKNYGIGKNNDIPWRLKADMAWFRKVTTEVNGDKLNAVIMGRKTWDSLPERFRPLPDRENIVISRNPSTVSAPHIFKKMDEALEYAYSSCEKVFVIGGASIYKQAMEHPQLNELIITHIDHAFDCDTYFPSLENYKIEEVIQEGVEGDLSYSIKRYVPL